MRDGSSFAQPQYLQGQGHDDAPAIKPLESRMEEAKCNGNGIIRYHLQQQGASGLAVQEASVLDVLKSLKCSFLADGGRHKNRVSIRQPLHGVVEEAKGKSGVRIYLS